MRVLHKDVSMEDLCGLFGYTRQNFYKVHSCFKKQSSYETRVLEVVKAVRVDQSRIGTIKLQSIINARLDEPIGRDRLFQLLKENKLLIRRRKKYRPQMTDGNGKSKYPDLRKGLNVNRINQLWCSDFTYISLNTRQRHCYLICITDEYSHLIVGYHLGLRMRTSELLIALRMALSKELKKGQTKFKKALVFHSDRGTQFKSEEFKECCEEYNILSSMCAKGKSHENPVAERLNGILKNEILEEDCFDSFELAKKAIDKTILIYNEQRPHLSCNLLTPQQAHTQNGGPLKKLWKQRKQRKQKKKKNQEKQT